MVSQSKNKIIQVQKPAQSLQAFQKKVASGEDLQTGILKPMLIGAGIVLGLGVAVFGFQAWRASSVEKHEASLAALKLYVSGDATEPVPPAEVEKHMREKLPELETLARKAPGPCREATQGLLATWKLELDGTGGLAASQEDAWAKLRLAQKHIALGKAPEALTLLETLRRSAEPSKAWSSVFWTTLLDADRLKGDRAQALRDVADYKARYKTKADPAIEHMLQGV